MRFLQNLSNYIFCVIYPPAKYHDCKMIILLKATKYTLRQNTVFHNLYNGTIHSHYNG